MRTHGTALGVYPPRGDVRNERGFAESECLQYAFHPSGCRTPNCPRGINHIPIVENSDRHRALRRYREQCLGRRDRERRERESRGPDFR